MLNAWNVVHCFISSVDGNCFSVVHHDILSVRRSICFQVQLCMAGIPTLPLLIMSFLLGRFPRCLIISVVICMLLLLNIGAF